MSNHAPGPWRWRVGRGHSCVLVGSDGKVILEAVGVEGMEANDDLIAAAPDLLKELSSVADWLSHPDERVLSDSEVAAIHAAIAKATGEQP